MTSLHKRQTAMFNPVDHEARHVTIIGLGNIGSHTTLALTRMGIKNFTLYDFDNVEEHNLASQAYEFPQLGLQKVNALSGLMYRINKEVGAVEHKNDAFRGSEPVKDILIIAVDSMVERKKIYEQLMATSQNPFVIDGRMGGGQIEVHAQYANDWGATFSDNPDSDPCSARYISYTSYIIAGAIANTLKRYLQGERMTKRLLMHVDTWDVITEWYEQN